MVEITLGLIAALAWGLHDFFVRFIVKKVNIFTALIITNVVGILALSVVLVFSKKTLVVEQPFLLISAIYGLLFLAATYSLYKAFDQGPVFIAAPIIGSYPLLSLLYAAMIGTSPEAYQWLLSALVIVGLALTVSSQITKNTSFKSHILPTVGWSLLAALLFSVSFQLGQNQIINGQEVLSNLFARLAAATTLFTFAFKKMRPLGLSFNQILVLVFMGLADTIALTIMVYAGNYSRPEFSSVSASTFGLITILLVCIIYKERLSKTQSAGIMLVFSSIAILSLA